MIDDKFLMVDIETLDTQPSAVIISVGAVLFDKTGILQEKEWTLDQREQARVGRTIDPETVRWWINQGEEAKRVFANKDQVTLTTFAEEFGKFFLERGTRIVGNGADFDVAILLDLWRRTWNIKAPWQYSKVICYRTINAMTGCKEKVARTGTHHRALDDARYQAECMLWALREIDK